MRTLIVGAGALGGLIAARMRAAQIPVSLATRDETSARTLRASGLRVSGVGGSFSVEIPDVASLPDHLAADARFDLIVLATKAHDAIAVAPDCARLLAPGGTLLPIQNGGVSQLLAERLGTDTVLGGLSNLGATMHAPGVYEQRNAGHLLIGEVQGGITPRAERVRAWLGGAVAVRATGNLQGAVWSKLLLNCSVTTLGAIAGQTMREYIATASGRALFDLTYDEALSVALATGARPERMIVDPIPPDGRSRATPAYSAWLNGILTAYGDLKASMLGDFERGRRTEVDFINGYVVEVGRRLEVPTPLNAALVLTVQAITRGEKRPSSALLASLLQLRAQIPGPKTASGKEGAT